MTKRKQACKLSASLDKGIALYVKAIRKHRIDTFESWEGGKKHSYAEPTVRFDGGPAEGFRAVAAALECGLRVFAHRRTWPIGDGEPTGPWCEITFTRKA